MPNNFRLALIEEMRTAMNSTVVLLFTLAMSMGVAYPRSQGAFLPTDHELPAGVPPVSQESIDIAVAHFKIRVPQSSEFPELDRELEDRGATYSPSFFGGYKIIKIGRAAFSSWGMLGATLAHEAEVHGNQNFSWVVVRDAFLLQGTEQAECDAYRYEVNNAVRFGLTEEEVRGIEGTALIGGYCN